MSKLICRWMLKSKGGRQQQAMCNPNQTRTRRFSMTLSQNVKKSVRFQVVIFVQNAMVWTELMGAAEKVTNKKFQKSFQSMSDAQTYIDNMVHNAPVNADIFVQVFKACCVAKGRTHKIHKSAA